MSQIFVTFSRKEWKHLIVNYKRLYHPSDEQKGPFPVFYRNDCYNTTVQDRSVSIDTAIAFCKDLAKYSVCDVRCRRYRMMAHKYSMMKLALVGFRG